ncbi:Predicted arabinose efflux permease, MFS family [Tardiphaga sp. OK246]|jgi:predicted MFS family arabinose efflux permease|uniref:MFS transporter n=1 Tax=Tardiphaga sp. OK246 TaxID=1855307 RepID=UPI000B687492|nr:MFS transporter [Tardiphaga sp. OK246]SNT14083.1 Predicted arabinose efflux permease, MFS family [Tardiphaga sp. OK246]
MPPVLNIIALASFAAALSMRALDPVLPHVADDLSITVAIAAGLASALAFTFAIVQPALGAAADLFGKPRLMIVCLVLLGIANILGAITTSYPLLLATRVLAGIGAGGVFPVTLSLTSDLVGPKLRQVALSRVMAGAMTGNLLGSTASGVIGDFFGWRGVLVILGGLAIVASVAVAYGFKGAAIIKPTVKADFGKLAQGYKVIFRNPNTLIVYSAVFVEGCCILGLFPYISSFLFDRGVTSLSIAGLVIACFAVGGLFYTATVSRMLARLGINGMMIYGGIVIAIQLAATAFSPNWQIQALSLLLMGWGFYMLHGSLQIFSTELSQEARASAMSLHAFCFFMGQSVGPIAYGFGLAHAGKMPTLLLSAAIVFALGFAAAKLLKPMKPTDAKA